MNAPQISMAKAEKPAFAALRAGVAEAYIASRLGFLVVAFVTSHRLLRAATAAIAATALFGVGAGPSMAAPPAPPPVSFQQAWTGFYLGGNLGMRSSQANWDAIDFFGPPIDGASSQSFNDAAFRAGLYFGYNWQFAPRWVAGVEADWGWADKTTTQAGFLPGFSGVFFPILPGDTVSVRTTWDASLRARLGYLVTPSLLLYGTGGLAWQHYKIESTCGEFNCGLPVATATADMTRLGWTIGGGIEMTVDRNWLARAEYRYANFGTARVTLDYPSPISAPATADIKLTTNTFLFGLAYRFDPANRGDAGASTGETTWPAPGQSGWNGGYIGLSAGARSSQSKWTTTQVFFFPAIPGLNEELLNDTAFRGGLYAGYNWQFAPRWIVGLEGDWGRGNKTTSQIGFMPGVSGVFGPIAPGDSISVRTTWDASLRARLGFLATPTLLVYGTGGLAWQHYDIQSVCGAITCLAEISATSARTKQGWTVGGGIETTIIGAWHARAEYRYAHFGTSQHTLDYGVVLGGAGAFPTTVGLAVLVPATVNINLNTHTVLLGVGYYFN